MNQTAASISLYGFIFIFFLQAIEGWCLPTNSGICYLPNLIIVWIIGIWGGVAVANRYD